MKYNRRHVNHIKYNHQHYFGNNDRLYLSSKRDRLRKIHKTIKDYEKVENLEERALRE